MGRRENGEGCISKKPRKDGRYQGYVDVGINPKTGRKKRKYIYGKTLKEVREKRNEINGQVYSGTYCHPGKTTFGEWLDNWLHLYKGNGNIKQTTWERYESIIENHLKPYLGQKKLGNLQTSDLQRVYNKKLDEGLSVRTVRYIHQTANGALGQANKEEKIPRNPALATNLPPLPRRKKGTYSDRQLREFLALSKKETQYFEAFVVTAYTGLRRGELLALRWKDIDLEKKTLTVEKNLVRTKSGLSLEDPKTNSAKRTLMLPDIALMALTKQLNWQKRYFKEKGWSWVEDIPVFCTKNGGPIDPNYFSRTFKKVARKLETKGFPEISLHGLRHTYATLFSEKGINILAISESLGHHSPDFTMKVYTHVTPKMREDATEIINESLKKHIIKKTGKR